ncbi:MAG: CBS domain-containing protein, partial [Nitrospirae bacterium]|nr:CBS domain-containing protein [Nitrospirota bacterium]
MKNRSVYDPQALKELVRERDTLKRLQTFPYSETLASVMITDVYKCNENELVFNIVREMARRKISSVVVVDDNDSLKGIITERDILTKVVARGCKDIQWLRATSIMTPEPITMHPDDTIYNALSVLNRAGIKHLPVTDKEKIVGIVTLRQLLNLRHPEPMSLIMDIYRASTPEELRQIRDRIPFIAAQKLSIGIGANDIVAMISMINSDIHRRIFELVIQEYGESPADLCVFVSGSHGRMENLLTPDQDHAMVLESEELYYDNLNYYMEITKAFSDWLNIAGFDYCPGYVMSVNPIWRKPLAEWKSQLWYWFNRQVGELGRYITILFDSRFLPGEKGLFNEFMTFAYEMLKSHRETLRVLHEEESSHKAPIGFLGRFITEKEGKHKGQIDIKRSGLIFVVEGIRILALMHDIRETSTIKRIERLVDSGYIHKDDGVF